MKILVVANMYPSEKDPVYGTFIKVFHDDIKRRNTAGSTNLCTIRGRRFGAVSKLVTYISYYLRLCGHLLFSRYDLIYVHTITFPTPALLLASVFRNLPLVFNVHGDDVLPSNRFKKLLKKMSAPLLAKARMVVAPSEYFRNVLQNEFPWLDKNRIFVSPSGGIKKLFFSVKEPSPLAGRALRLGYV
ncbi:MAG: glycosyltransferase, partial [Muribaculaceae bacterium]|nr:glycosyltransferase [Muribaculaceae bacterium]